MKSRAPKKPLGQEGVASYAMQGVDNSRCRWRGGETCFAENATEEWKVF